MIQSGSNLRHTERVVLFPSYGRLTPDGRTWRLYIFGAVFDPEMVRLRKRMMLRVLRRVLNVEPEDLDSEIFRQRIEAFAARTEAGKRIVVWVGKHMLPLRQGSQRNGRFRGVVRISREDMDQLRAEGELLGQRLRIRIYGSPGSDRETIGFVHLLNEQGLSVISDIDDTIKHTNVFSRRELLANTFLREFRSIDGMAAVYRDLADRGAAFHYVSSSPWQLYQPLADLCGSAGFPCGTFHLRDFRFRDHMLRRFSLHRAGKAMEIRRLIESFPRRKFVLVGDSGERDPEIYGRLAQMFPHQVQGIFIRELGERPFRDDPIRRLNGAVANASIDAFEEPDELARLWLQLERG